MKKFFTKVLTLAISSVIAFGVLCPAEVVFAASHEWTESYATFLWNMVEDVKNEREFYTEFALHDIDGDGIPELFLKNTSVDGGYKIFNSDSSKATLEKTFYSNDFYLTLKGELIISYGDENGNTFVYYDEDLSLANSVKLLRFRRDKQDRDGNWEYIYYYKNKQVSKEEYDRQFREQLELLPLSFYDIVDENINVQVYQGIGFPADGSETYFYITKGPFNSPGQVQFRDSNKVNAADIFGLLMVNGTVVTNAFPIYVDGRTLVPVRAVSESLNAVVEWVGDIQKIIVTGNTRIEMFVNNNTAVVDGEKVSLDVAPQIIDGTTYVPIRFVSESLGADVYFVEGENNFPALICVESSENNEITGFREDDAEYKVNDLFRDIRWLGTGSVFIRGYMDERVSIKSEGLIANRFWSVKLDERGTQKIWVDRYTGQVFSKYDGSGACGIQVGIDAAVSALLELYAR